MFWLLKTEPTTFSFADLKRDKETNWDGVRNYQARNNLRAMRVHDLVFIYHSVTQKCIVGIAKVTKEAFKDETCQNGDWSAVKVAYVKDLKNPVPLSLLKQNKKLINLALLKQGRLSVCPVTETEWNIILAMAN